MFIFKFRKICGLIALLLIPAGASATLASAQAAYARGLALERAKDYQGAIAEYQGALAQYPTYFYAEKQLGNCFYYTGDKVKSLRSYDAYLAIKPDDEATRDFADQLRVKVEAEEDDAAPRRGRRRGRRPALPTRPQDRSPENGAILDSSFYLGGSVNWLNNSGDDLKDHYSAAQNPTVSNTALYEDIHLGYLFKNGLALEGGFEILERVSSVSYTYYSSYYYNYLDYDTFTGTETVFFIEPMYRLPINRLLAVSLGTKVGYVSANIKNSSYYYSSYSNYSGNGFLVAPAARFQILPGGRVGLELGAEYRMDDISTVTGASGTTSNWHINNGGLAFRFGINIYFNRLTRS